MWKSSIPAFLHVKPVDSVPTNAGCRTSPPDHAKLEHRSKLCVGTTPFAWLIKKDSARSEQGKPILVGPASVLPFPPPRKDSQQRLLLAVTGKGALLAPPWSFAAALYAREWQRGSREAMYTPYQGSWRTGGFQNVNQEVLRPGRKKVIGDVTSWPSSTPPPPPPFFCPWYLHALSIIHNATTLLSLCILLQALTPLCAQAFTASGGGPSHKKTGKMSEWVPHWRATVFPTFYQALRNTWAQATRLSTSRQRPLPHPVVTLLGAEKFDITTLPEKFWPRLTARYAGTRLNRHRWDHFCRKNCSPASGFFSAQQWKVRSFDPLGIKWSQW